MKDFLFHPFALGLYTGGVFLLIAFYHLLRTRLEFKRYRRMLSDKMELDAAAVSKLKTEIEALRKENENLRVKVQGLTNQPAQKLARDLEVYARAEKKMTVAAPGFAGPWEQAKEAAHLELADEEGGKSAPRTLFQRFFGGGNAEPVQSLPQTAEANKQNSPGGS